MTHTTTLPARPAPIAIGYTLERILRDFILPLALPGDRLRTIDAELTASNAGRVAGQKFRLNGDAGRLRTWYTSYRTAFGVLSLAGELEGVASRGGLAETLTNEHKRQQENGRMSQFERTHDLPEFVSAVRSAVRFLGEARAYREPRQQPLDPGDLRRLLPMLAREAIARWLPAMQNIIAQLPERLQAGAASDAALTLSGYLRHLDRLHELTRTVGPERERWKWGFGAIDAAIYMSAAMVHGACEIATGLPEGADTYLLRRRADEARESVDEELEQLSKDRIEALNLRIYPKQCADMVEFARGAGGIGPELEILFHTGRSRMLVG